MTAQMPVVPVEKPISVTIEKVTPELAEVYLGHNYDNRKLDPPTVMRYAQAMRAGKWKLSHQGIAFDVTGKLADGQHRCEACKISQTPFETFVIRNAPPDMFDVVDVGKRRSAGDTMGLLGVKQRQVTASALKVMKNYSVAQRTTGMSLYQAMRLSMENYELPLWFEMYPGIAEFVGAGVALQKQARCLRSSAAVVATLYLHSLEHPMETQTFVEAVLSLTNLEPYTGPWHIMKREQDRAGGAAGMAMSMLYLHKALDLWTNGKTVKKFLVPPDARFPDLGWLDMPDYGGSLGSPVTVPVVRS